MPKLVVIGGSAGSITALRIILSGLPEDFAAPVLIAVHIGSRESILPSLLQNHCALQVRHPSQRQSIVAGQVLVAPSDLHLTVVMDAGQPQAKLVNGPKENHCRPAIDPLFRSGAIAYGAGTIGILLSGFLDDGTVGLQAIKAYGGVAVVQDPDEAEAPEMPASALENADIDFKLPADAIARKLVELVGRRAQAPGAHADTAFDSARERIVIEDRMLDEHSNMDNIDQVGAIASLTCPECHGVMWEVHDDKLLRYRCHTGHAFTAKVLAALQNAAVEEALWGAVRALHEQEQLYQRLYDRTSRLGQNDVSTEYLDKSSRAREQARILRELIATRVSTR